MTGPTQDYPINGRKWQTARFAPSQHDDLLSQHQDPGLQRRAWPEQINDSLKNYPAEIQHPAEDHPILRLMPTGWNLRQGQVSQKLNDTGGVKKRCPGRRGRRKRPGQEKTGNVLEETDDPCAVYKSRILVVTAVREK
jgi:hypothetical protein